MTSQARVAANRKNARRSTGPRTAAGKRSSSRNAFRHGLDAIHIHEPLTHETIKRLATMICADDSEPIEHDLATTIAECQVTLSRIRAARISAVERMRTTGDPSYIPSSASAPQLEETITALAAGNARPATRSARDAIVRTQRVMQEAIADNEVGARSLAEQELPAELAANYSEGKRHPRSDAESFQLAIPELLAIERYERRALSRRRRAMEAYRFIRDARLILDGNRMSHN